MCETVKLIVFTPHMNHDISPNYNHMFAPYHSNPSSSISPTVYLVSSTSPPLPTVTYERPPQSPMQFHAPTEPLFAIHPASNSDNSSSGVSDYFALILNPLAHSEDLGLSYHVSSVVTAQDWHTDNGDSVGGTSNMEFECPNPLYCNQCTDATYFDPPRTFYNGFNFNSMEVGMCRSVSVSSYTSRNILKSVNMKYEL